MAITKSGRDWKRLHAALQQDEVAKVREISGRLDLNEKKKYREVCLAAAKVGASNALEALLEAGGGFRFNAGWSSDRNYAETMLQAAIASQNPAPLLSVIYAANKKEGGSNKLYESEFITKDTPEDIIRSCLEKNPGLFENFVKTAGLNLTDDSTEKLKVILDYAANAPNTKSVLDNALITVAGTGDVEKTTLLLERQADPKTEAAQSLFEAGKNGHQKVVDLLLPHITPVLCRSVLERLQQRPEKNEGIIAAIEAAAQRVIIAQPVTVAAEPLVPAPPQQDTRGYRAVDADTLELNQTLSDGTRRVLYDFVNEIREITVTIKGASTPGVTTVSFDDIKKEITDDKRRILDELNHKPHPRTPLRLNASPA